MNSKLALATLALACLTRPVWASENAAEPVTWGQIAVFGAWALGGLVVLVVAAIVIVVLLALAGVFNDWSH